MYLLKTDSKDNPWEKLILEPDFSVLKKRSLVLEILILYKVNFVYSSIGTNTSNVYCCASVRKSYNGIFSAVIKDTYRDTGL